MRNKNNFISTVVFYPFYCVCFPSIPTRAILIKTSCLAVYCRNSRHRTLPYINLRYRTLPYLKFCYRALRFLALPCSTLLRRTFPRHTVPRLPQPCRTDELLLERMKRTAPPATHESVFEVLDDSSPARVRAEGKGVYRQVSKSYRRVYDNVLTCGNFGDCGWVLSRRPVNPSPAGTGQHPSIWMLTVQRA